MDKFYVQQYGQLENSHWWFLIRQRIILQTLRKFIPVNPEKKLKILNVGAAAGGSSKWLSDLGDVTSVENDPLFLTHLADQHLIVINASITNLPLDDNAFDLVCAFDVIEHVEDEQKAIKELTRVCKPGGKICITVPAFQSLWGNHDIVNGHKRRYKKGRLQNILESQSAAVLYASYFNSVLFIPVFLMRKIRLWFNKTNRANASDFTYFKTNSFTNKILKSIFGMEVHLLRLVRFPFGVSLIAVARKKDISEGRE
ncbi:MAG: class I SAM-dependent methyltransferase [Ferruginibacter sp.]